MDDFTLNNNVITQLLSIARLAGEEILKVYNSDDYGVEHKTDDSPLTKADKAAHNKIMEYLSITGIPTLSEEGADIPYEERKQWNSYWLVDPLDGTKEFIKRNGEFTVNIA
ncbi:MAG: 3'(2'),5'-bisphosphate nucleotidase CysQ family protein, partial [Bacteroidia bacterium]